MITIVLSEAQFENIIDGLETWQGELTSDQVYFHNELESLISYLMECKNAK